MSDALLGMIGTGLSLFGGIEGLLGASSAETQAEQAAEQAITQFKSSSNQQYNDLLSQGTAGLNTLSGGLANALTNTGRSLGASLAGAGVWNSTGAAGALANQGAANAATEGRYSTSLANELANQQAQTSQQAAQMQYGLATNNLNFARQQQQGAVSGLSQLFGNLGQMNFGSLFGKQGGGYSSQMQGVDLSQTDIPTNGIVQPIQNQFMGGQPGTSNVGYGNF